jgi:predicted amidohydrolase YtcJ
MTLIRDALLTATLAALIFGTGAQAALPSADALLVHGHLYTADPNHPWAEAMAVKAGRIVAIGDEKTARAAAPRGAAVIDLHGRTALPGLVDAHVHLLFGSLELDGLNLSTPARSITPDQAEEFAKAVRAFASGRPSARLLIVRADFGTADPIAPHHELLDLVVPDRPVIVHNSSEHALYVNAAALALAGIGDEPLADPVEEKGVIRDALGHPTGVLLEAAQETMERAVLPIIPTQEKLRLLEAGMRHLNSYGITSIVNATGDLAELDLYGQLRDEGRLTLRTRTAFGAVAYPHRLTTRFLADLEAARTRYHDEWVDANLVKFFSDGSTGLAPPIVYQASEYKRIVSELDRRGFDLMTHAQRGDSVHLILDAYEAAIRANGPRSRRLRIEHDFLIKDGDLPRYHALGVIAGVQPDFCCQSLGTGYDATDPTVADRWRSLIDSGATLAMSTDWPCSWPPDPWVNVKQAVTRQVWHSDDTGSILSGPFDGANQGGARPVAGVFYHPEERITVREAIDGYTRGSAYAARADERVGQLTVGRLADVVVLSQDPFSASLDELGGIHAVMTLVGGKVVFEDLN